MRLRLRLKTSGDPDAPVSAGSIFQRLRQGYLVIKRRGMKENMVEAVPGQGGPMVFAPGGGGNVAYGQFVFPGMFPPMPEPGKEDEFYKPGEEGAQFEGIEIPEKFGPFKTIDMPLERKELERINVYYQLIPSLGDQGLVFCYANIRWDPELEELIYHIVEPKITADEKSLIEYIKKDLEERLDVDLSKIGVVKARELLTDEIVKSIQDIPDLAISDERKRIVIYYVQKDILGYGMLEGMMQDPNIEDVSCDGVNIPIYVYHRDPRIGSIKANIQFRDDDELNSFVVKLSQRCNKLISVASPLLDGALPDGSRVQATLGTDIARKGSNFTIRKFTDKPLTPTHMLKYKTLNSTQLAYLWLAVENGESILVSGGTATGKSSLLNVLSLFINPSKKIVSIEDTPELRLPHPHWIPQVARSPLAIEHKVGEVTLFDLLKSSLRQRPDYIIVGEVRGKEAFVLFQQIATGHAGIATIHAASFPQLMDRLITPPISLPPTLLENINIVVFLVLSKIKNRYERRSNLITEIIGVKENKPLTNDVFKWIPISDTFKTMNKSAILKNIATRMGMTEDSIKEEIYRRKRILEWMFDKGMYDYRDVGKIIATYYTNPREILKRVEPGER